MSSTKIHKFLNIHPEARKIFDKNEKNITRENDQNSKRSGRMTKDGDSLAVYTRVVN